MLQMKMDYLLWIQEYLNMNNKVGVVDFLYSKNRVVTKLTTITLQEYIDLLNIKDKYEKMIIKLNDNENKKC